MLIQSKLVYDEFLTTGAPQYTDAEFNDLLGQYDQISIQAVVDQATALGFLTVRIEHCADGRNFVNKSGSLTAEIDTSGTGPGQGAFATGVTNPLTGMDQGLSPSLGFVRLKLSISAGTAHVKIHVTMRDQTGATPVAPDTPAISKEAYHALDVATKFRKSVLGY